MNKTSKKSWNPIRDNIFSTQEWGKYPPISLVRFIAKNFYIQDKKKIKILEVGCGTGANIWYLAKEGFNAYGIDGCKKAIELCKKRIKSEGLSANLKVGDIIDLPYEDNFFDCIIDIECLYSNTIENTHKILKEINRVLKKDGLFFSMSFTENTFIGTNFINLGDKQFNNIKEGPLKGKGLARLMNKTDIYKLYGKYFDILEINRSSYTVNNDTNTIEEWLIICRKHIL